MVNPRRRGRPRDSVRHDARARVASFAIARGLAQPYSGAAMERIFLRAWESKAVCKNGWLEKANPFAIARAWRCRTAAKASRRPLCAICNRAVDGGMIDLDNGGMIDLV